MKLPACTLAVLILIGLSMTCLSLKRVLVRKLGGNYLFKVTAVEDCPGIGNIETEDKFNFRLARHDRYTVALEYDMNLTRAIDDSWTGSMYISIWGNGGWKPNFFNWVVTKEACTKLEKNVFVRAQDTNFKCPLPPGSYKSFVNATFDFFPLLPSAPFGKYLATSKMYYPEGKLAFCIALHVQFEQDFSKE